MRKNLRKIPVYRGCGAGGLHILLVWKSGGAEISILEKEKLMRGGLVNR
jgi:hypothetical protein